MKKRTFKEKFVNFWKKFYKCLEEWGEAAADAKRR